ncbi:MAG: methyltransferase [Alistipes sp.]|nr:methyltransferase [Alistipes sp.]
MFEFKQFSVDDEQCAMKVGTDGVLLGAWVDVAESKHILDIGTGSGLIALMVAQRSVEAKVLGIDIDANAVCQARSNFAKSPWSERLTAEQCDVRELYTEQLYDHIVSNPPYFVETTESPNESRATARHATHLKFADIIAVAERLLADGGGLSVILPTDVAAMFRREAFERLWLVRQMDISTKEGEAPRRTMMEFRRVSEPVMPKITTLTIRHKDSTYTDEYRRLAEDFYISLK